MHHAASNGHLDIVKFLSSNLTDKNPSDDNGATPLHYAAFGGHLDIVKYLTSLLEDKNPKSGLYWNEDTPLHVAADYRKLEVVKYFVQILPDNNPENAEGKTPLDMAKAKGHQEIVDFLESLIIVSDFFRNHFDQF